MEWTEICSDPLLNNLPYKIQTDQWGNIMMSPASNEHGILQAKIVALINRLMTSGTIIAECSVQTPQGVKVADVSWASDKFMQRNKGLNPFIEAPDICVEILSPSNTRAEMAEKKELYFARGAKEFWLCDADGQINFYTNTGTLNESLLIQDFPQNISLI